MKKYLILFATMLKIGLFTFGGGYAMIALLESEFVTRKKWLDDGEFMDMVAIAESTPGPIAINAATYIGYKFGKTAGAVICTLAVCIPSFAIIYAVSLFFDAFLQIEQIAAAFKGIQACVIFLILAAGVKMLIKLPKTAFNIAVFAATFGCMTAFSLFSVGFSSVFYILISAALGEAVYLAGYIAKRKKNASSAAPNAGCGKEENKGGDSGGTDCGNKDNDGSEE